MAGLLSCSLLVSPGYADNSGDPTRADLESGYESIFKAHDANSDAMLSKTEIQAMVDYWRSASNQPFTEEWMDWLLNDLAAQDADQDGYLSLAEFLKAPLANFDCMDKNEDTRLTVEEIQVGMGRCVSGEVFQAE